jgi:putative transposase
MGLRRAGQGRREQALSPFRMLLSAHSQEVGRLHNSAHPIDRSNSRFVVEQHLRSKSRASWVGSMAERPRHRRVARRGHQLELALVLARDGTRRGGSRPRSGRKCASKRKATPHRARPIHRAAEPVHVTLRSLLGPLRSQFLFPTVCIAIARANQRDPRAFRVIQYSVQHDHLHLLVEASGKRELSAGMRSVAIRIARYVNDLLGRRGRFWADRWHGRGLRSPSEVRTALVYVLANFRKHARRSEPEGIDPYSSGANFDGWREWSPRSGTPPPYARRPPWSTSRTDASVVAATTWLATVGFRRAGLVRLAEAPLG